MGLADSVVNVLLKIQGDATGAESALDTVRTRSGDVRSYLQRVSDSISKYALTKAETLQVRMARLREQLEKLQEPKQLQQGIVDTADARVNELKEAQRKAVEAVRAAEVALNQVRTEGAAREETAQRNLIARQAQLDEARRGSSQADVNQANAIRAAEQNLIQAKTLRAEQTRTQAEAMAAEGEKSTSLLRVQAEQQRVLAAESEKVTAARKADAESLRVVAELSKAVDATGKAITEGKQKEQSLSAQILTTQSEIAKVEKEQVALNAEIDRRINARATLEKQIKARHTQRLAKKEGAAAREKTLRAEWLRNEKAMLRASNELDTSTAKRTELLQTQGTLGHELYSTQVLGVSLGKELEEQSRQYIIAYNERLRLQEALNQAEVVQTGAEENYAKAQRAVRVQQERIDTLRAKGNADSAARNQLVAEEQTKLRALKSQVTSTAQAVITARAAVDRARNEVRTVGVDNTTAVNGAQTVLAGSRVRERERTTRLTTATKELRTEQVALNQINTQAAGIEGQISKTEEQLAIQNQKDVETANRRAEARNKVKSASTSLAGELTKVGEAGEQAGKRTSEGFAHMSADIGGVFLRLQGMQIGLQMAGQGFLQVAMQGENFLKGAIEDTAQFDQNLIATAGVASKIPSTVMEPIRQMALSIGRDSQYTATEGLNVIDQLVRSGVSLNTIFGQMADHSDGAARAVTTLATATGSSLSDALNTVIVGTNVFAEQQLKASQIMDTAGKAVNSDKMTLKDYNDALKTSGQIASELKIPYQQVSESISTLARAGITGTTAGTALKYFWEYAVPKSGTALQTMEQYGLATFNTTKATEMLTKRHIKFKPTQDGVLQGLYQLAGGHGKLADSTRKDQTAFDKFVQSRHLTSSVFFDAAGNFRGVTTEINELGKALQGKGQDEQLKVLQTIFGLKAGSTSAAVLLQQFNQAMVESKKTGQPLADVFFRIQGAMTAMQSPADIAAEKMLTLEGREKFLKGSLSALMNELTEPMQAPLTKALDMIGRLVNGIEQAVANNEGLRNFVAMAALLGVIGVHVVGVLLVLGAAGTYLVPILGGMAAAVLPVVGVLTLLVGALIGIGAALLDPKSGVSGAFQTMIGLVTGSVNTLRGIAVLFVTQILAPVSRGIASTVTILIGLVNQIISVVLSTLPGIISGIGQMLQRLAPGAQFVMGIFGQVATVIIAAVRFILAAWPVVVTAFLSARQQLTPVWNFIKQGIQGIVDFLVQHLVPTIQLVIAWIVQYLPVIASQIMSVFNAVKPVLDGIGTAVGFLGQRFQVVVPLILFLLGQFITKFQGVQVLIYAGLAVLAFMAVSWAKSTILSIIGVTAGWLAHVGIFLFGKDKETQGFFDMIRAGAKWAADMLVSMAKATAGMVASVAKAIWWAANQVRQFLIVSVQAAIHARRVSARWIASTIATNGGVLGTIASFGRMVGSFVTTSVQAGIHAGYVAARWLITSAIIVGSVVKDIVIGGAKMIWSFAQTAIAAAANAAVVSRQWVAAGISANGGILPFLVSLGKLAIGFAVTAVQATGSAIAWAANGVALGVATAATWLWNLAGEAASVVMGILDGEMLPVILTILVLAAAAFLLYEAWTNNFLGIQDFVKSVLTTIRGWFDGFLNWVGQVIGWLGDTFTRLTGQSSAAAGNAIKGFKDKWDRGLDAVTKGTGIKIDGIQDILKIFGFNAGTLGGTAGGDVMANFLAGIQNGLPELDSQLQEIDNMVADVGLDELDVGMGLYANPSSGLTKVRSRFHRLDRFTGQANKAPGSASYGFIHTSAQIQGLPTLPTDPNTPGDPGTPPPGMPNSPYTGNGANPFGPDPKNSAANKARRAKSAAESAAQIVKTVADAIKAAITAFKQLSTMVVPRNLERKAKEFSARAAVVVGEVQKVAMRFDSKNDVILNRVSKFADAADKSMKLIGTGVDAFRKLKEFKVPLTSQIQSFVNVVSRTVAMFEVVSKKFQMDSMVYVGDFADSASKVVDLIGKGVDAFKKLDGFKAPMTSSIKRLVDSVQRTLTYLAPIASAWGPQALDDASAFADRAGKVADGLSKGIDFLVKLGSTKTDFSGLRGRVHELENSVQDMMNTLGPMTSGWVNFSVDVSAFADAASKVADSLLKAVDFLDKLKSSKTSFKDLSGRVKEIRNATQQMMNVFGPLTEWWTTTRTAQAQAFADRAGKVADALLKSIDFLDKLRSSKTSYKDLASRVIEIANRTQQMMNVFGPLSRGWTAFTADVTAFADRSSKVADALGKALAFLDRLRNSKTPFSMMTARVDELAQATRHMMDTFRVLTPDWGDFNRTMVTFADTTSKVADALSKSLDFLDKLKGSKTPFKDLAGRVDELENATRHMMDSISPLAAPWEDFANRLTPFADASSKIADSLGKSIDFLDKLSSDKHTSYKDLADRVREVVNRTADIMAVMAHATPTDFDPGTIPAFADSAGKVFDALLKVLDVLDRLGTTTKRGTSSQAQALTGILVDTIRAYRDRMVQAGIALDDTGAEAATLAGQVADGQGKIVRTLSAAFDLFTKLGEYIQPRKFNPQANFQNLLDFMKFLINQFVLVKVELEGVLTPEVVAFADELGKTIGGLSAALDVFIKLEGYTGVSQSRVTNFIDALKFTIEKLRDGLLTEIAPELLDLASEFGTKLGPVFDLMSKAFSLFMGLMGQDSSSTTGSKTTDKSTQGLPWTDPDRIFNFINALKFTIEKLRDGLLTQIAPEMLDLANEFGTKIGPAMDVLTKALGIFLSIQGNGKDQPGLKPIDPDRIGALVGSLYLLLHHWRNIIIGGEFQGDFAERSAVFAQTVRTVLEQIQKVIDLANNLVAAEGKGKAISSLPRMIANVMNAVRAMLGQDLPTAFTDGFKDSATAVEDQGDGNKPGTLQYFWSNKEFGVLWKMWKAVEGKGGWRVVMRLAMEGAMSDLFNAMVGTMDPLSKMFTGWMHDMRDSVLQLVAALKELQRVRAQTTFTPPSLPPGTNPPSPPNPNPPPASNPGPTGNAQTTTGNSFHYNISTLAVKRTTDVAGLDRRAMAMANDRS